MKLKNSNCSVFDVHFATRKGHFITDKMADCFELLLNYTLIKIL